MNDNQSNLNTKLKGAIKIKKTNIMYKPKKGLWKEDEKVNATPNFFGRNLNVNIKPAAIKAFSPTPQRFNSNFDMSNKKKIK